MSTVQEILTKLHKLKDQASTAPDFLSLQKVSGKVDKIRAKLANYTSNKQFTAILDKINMLISEKNKYFRQKMIKTSSKLIGDDNLRNQEANKTLKYSKSAQNLKINNSKKISNNLAINSNIINKAMQGEIQETGGFKSQNIDEQNNTINKIHKDKTVYIRQSRQNIKSNREEIDDLLETSSIRSPQTEANTKKSPKKINNNRNSQKNINKVTADNNQSQDDAQKTTFNAKNMNLKNQEKERLKGEVNFLEQKLSFSFKQIEDLTKKVNALQNNSKQKSRNATEQHRSPMAKNLILKHESLIDQYTQKLRQKSFIIQDLTGKIQYLSSMNEQLKNRVLNQQRRNEDYIEGLKNQIKNLKKQVEKYKKQNQNFLVDFEDLQEKNLGLMNQIKKLVRKLEDEVKDKQRVKKAIAASAASKSQQLQKQIAHLSTQSANLCKLQIKLQHEQQQKQQLLEYKQKIQQRINQIQRQSKSFQEQRNKIQLQLFKLQQQNKFLRNELKVNISTKQILAQQLLQVKQRLEEQLRVTNLLEYENDLKIKNKLNKLKQIKGLLTELK